MLRCDVHFKEVRAPFVTAAPAALGIFRVENKQPENVWNATWPFNLTRRRGFSQIPTERCWRARRLSCTQQTGAQRCGFSKPQPCRPSLLFPPTSRIQSARCCSSEAFSPSVCSSTWTCEARTKSEMDAKQVQVGAAFKVPPGRNWQTAVFLSPAFSICKTGVCEPSCCQSSGRTAFTWGDFLSFLRCGPVF